MNIIELMKSSDRIYRLKEELKEMSKITPTFNRWAEEERKPAREPEKEWT